MREGDVEELRNRIRLYLECGVTWGMEEREFITSSLKELIETVDYMEAVIDCLKQEIVELDEDWEDNDSYVLDY